MFTRQELIDYTREAKENWLNHISIDCVVFGFHEGQLKVLSLKLKDEQKWYLPGGFVLKDEHLDHAASRILHERTGLDEIFLQQFHVFGDPQRSRPHYEMYKDLVDNEDNWFSNRFITIGYYALVDFHNTVPAPDALSEKCVWCGLDDLPLFILDHKQILDNALDALRLQLNYQPIGYNLMPHEFTMPELQKLYETILDKKLDRRNFQRKILAFDILNRSEHPRKGGAHKAPYLYSFNLEKYQQALKEGLAAGW
jgi:ADP-ribose pyrophosphatase YjhB (NUDIX family)